MPTNHPAGTGSAAYVGLCGIEDTCSARPSLASFHRPLSAGVLPRPLSTQTPPQPHPQPGSTHCHLRPRPRPCSLLGLLALACTSPLTLYGIVLSLQTANQNNTESVHSKVLFLLGPNNQCVSPNEILHLIF